MPSVAPRSGSRPFTLFYEPVDFSLTDGTSIPAPPPELQEPKHKIRRKGLPTSPLSSQRPTHAPRTPSAPSSITSLSTRNQHGGPLSSHPITPVDAASPAGARFGREMPGPFTNGADDTSPNGYGHVSEPSSDSNNFDPALPAHQPAQDSSHRPSFVARFMRLRSSSFMRSKSSLRAYNDTDTPSTLSLSQQTGTTMSRTASTYTPTERGTKRPGSPMAGGPAAGPGNNTFPRMVRKKSMELLSTARRKSGMWSRTADPNGDIYQSAMDDERAREKSREEYLQSYRQDAEKVHRMSTHLGDGETSRLGTRNGTPPPTVQVRIGGDSLDGEDMFKDIGK